MIINENLQLDIIRYARTNKKVFKKLVPEVFTLDLNLLFSIYHEYFKKFNSLPENKETLLNYFDITALELGVDTQEVQIYLKNLINKSFDPISLDLNYVKENCLDIARRLALISLMGEYAENIQDLSYSFDFEHFIKSTKKISRFTANDLSGMFLFKDSGSIIENSPKIFRSEWESLNAWRNKGGFYSPEMYIIMAEMKSFKTTNLINLALGFIRKDKAKGLYIDTENGIFNLIQRGLQNISEQSFKDFNLKTAEKKAEEYLIKYDNADLFIQYLSPGSTINDVSDILDELQLEYDFVPDFIIYDDIDHLNPSTWSKDRYDRLNQVYKEAIQLNQERNLFSFTASQVNREGIDKKVKGMSDIAGAIGKIALAGGIYAVSGTDDEMEKNIFKLSIVAQREGKRKHPDNIIWLKVNPETQVITELDITDNEVVNLLTNTNEDKVDLRKFKVKINDR